MKKYLFSFASLILTVSVSLAQSPRLCLFEEFTGENCAPCAATNPGLNQLLASPTNSPKVVAIKWQVPIPSAPVKPWSLYQTNKAEINYRYGPYGYTSQWVPSDPVTNGINSAPQGRIDGQYLWSFGASSNHAGALNDNVIASAQSYTSAFSVSMNREWNLSCTAVNLTITIQATADFSSVGNLVFRTVMVERVIQFSVAPGTNGEKHFEDVAIKSFPSIQNGVALQKNWTNGQSQTFTLSCPIPSYTRDKEQIAMVGFIQDDGNKKVAQAARTSTDVLPVEALSQLDAKVDLTCSGTITPLVKVRNDGPSAINNLTIVPYNDNISGTPFSWQGTIASGDSASILLNSMPSPATSGGHVFTFDVIMSVPHYNLNGGNRSASYMVAASGITSVEEGFISTIFPPASWAVINSNKGAGWLKSSSAGGYNRSFNSAKYDFYGNNHIGDVDELYLPPMYLEGGGDPVLSFDMAYATRYGRSDKLEVLVSDDCGANWTSFFNKDGFNLATIANEVNTNAYTPDPFDSTHWTTIILPLTGFNKPQVLVKFVTTSDNGNNLYLDNINLARSTGVGLKEAVHALPVTVFPNPATGHATIRMETVKTELLKITILNTLGQEIYKGLKELNAGLNELSLDLSAYPAGVYNLQLSGENTAITKKLNIIK